MPLLSKNLLCFHKIIQNNIVIFYDFMIQDSKRKEMFIEKISLFIKMLLKYFACLSNKTFVNMAKN